MFFPDEQDSQVLTDFEIYYLPAFGDDAADMAVANGQGGKIQAGVRPGQKKGPLRSGADEAGLGFDHNLVISELRAGKCFNGYPVRCRPDGALRLYCCHCHLFVIFR